MRFIMAAALLMSSAAAADAKAVWRHYPSIVQRAAFAYVGPGNVLWRVYRTPFVARKPATKPTPPAAPRVGTVATPAPMVLLAPNIVAAPRVTAPSPPPPAPPVIAKPVETVTIAKAPEIPPTISMAEPAQAEPSTWLTWARLVVAAAITAIAVAMVVSGLARRRRAGPASA